MSEQTMQMAQGGALGVDSLMWLDMVPMFTGDATGIDIEVFFRILEEAGRLGENRLNRLEKLIEKSLGLHEYERDIKEEQRRSRPPPARGDDYSQLRHTAQECNWQPHDPRNEAISCQSTDGQNVEGIAERLEVNSVRGLIEEKALISVVDICGEKSALERAGEETEKLERKCQMKEASENEQGRECGAEASSSCEAPQIANQTDEESEDNRVETPFEIDSEPVTERGVVVKEVIFRGAEETSEMQTTTMAEESCGLALSEKEASVEMYPRESVEEQELENRLNRLEKLIEKSLGLHEYERDIKEEQRRSRPPPARGDDYSQLRHTAQECNWQPHDPRNEAISCQSTDGQNVEGIAERLEVNSVRGLIEEKALISVVDICGEKSALERAGEETEKLERKCQMKEASENEQGRECGAEASSSCEAPQIANQTDEESEDNRVETPFEIDSEPVTERGVVVKEVIFRGAEETSEMQTTTMAEESCGLALSEKEASVEMYPRERCTSVGSERRKQWTMSESVTHPRRRATGGGRSAITSVKVGKARFPPRFKLSLLRIEEKRPRFRMKHRKRVPHIGRIVCGLWRVRKTPGPRPHRARIKEVSDWQDSHGMFRMSPAVAA
ncbi:hypothetical protein HPB50_027691 [Hyalomma asiaticum]|nr:hypothetical protein HPB50_027691 [Hyalomma asiaticum]